MKFLKNSAKWILTIELVLVAVLVVGLMVPLPGSVSLKIVQSGSMEPAIPVGAVVTVVPQVHYAVGEVITFADPSTQSVPTTHRIVDVVREEGSTVYLTKGDANEEADRTVIPHSHVLGAVALSIPRLGYVLDFARSERGFFFMAVVPALLIILDEVLHIVGALRTRRTSVPTRPFQRSRESGRLQKISWIASLRQLASRAAAPRDDDVRCVASRQNAQVGQRVVVAHPPQTRPHPSMDIIPPSYQYVS